MTDLTALETADDMVSRYLVRLSRTVNLERFSALATAYIQLLSCHSIDSVVLPNVVIELNSLPRGPRPHRAGDTVDAWTTPVGLLGPRTSRLWY